MTVQHGDAIPIFGFRNITRKPNKVIVKLYDDDKFLDAVHIPSVMWPLNGSYELFHQGNSKPLESETVNRVLDSVNYRTGFCYSNADAVTKGLQAAGLPAKTYVGWLFCNEYEYPLHHCWTVLDGSVIDLSDCFTLMAINEATFALATTKEERDVIYIAFSKWLDRQPNHLRTVPGRPYQSLLYVGCECSPEEGKAIYNQVCDMYPNHPCNSRHTGPDHMTSVQRKMRLAGCK